MHGEQLRVDVVDSEPLEDHTGAADSGELPVEESRHFARREHEAAENLIGECEGVGGMVPLGNHHRETLGVREDRQEGEVVTVLQILWQGLFPWAMSQKMQGRFLMGGMMLLTGKGRS